MNNRIGNILFLVLVVIVLGCSEKQELQVSPDPELEESSGPITGIIDGSLFHEGLTRSYILYVPENYTGEEAVPLVLNFHGYTSNAKDQMEYGDFRTQAEEEGFIIVHPQGSLLEGETHFNVGGWTLESTVDDVGFTARLLDKLEEEYNIDAKRIYATGMSNGGYMSFLLACQLSERIAAIASVTGSMTPQTFNFCNPTHPMPIMQIHGTQDAVVPYGGANWTKSIGEVMNYWVEFNACGISAQLTDLADHNQEDGSTVQKQQYDDCQNNAQTIHYRIEKGGHTWAGSSIWAPQTNYDMNASEVIWAFFAQYDLDGLLE